MFRELTRKNSQLSPEEAIHILKTTKRGVLSVLSDNGFPYGMPMNHFYDDEDGCIYFHCGIGGHRSDALSQQGKVSFCTMDDGRQDGDWALRFRSVIVFGEMEVISEQNTVIDICEKLCLKFTDDNDYIQKEIAAHAHRTVLLKLTPLHICGKSVLES